MDQAVYIITLVGTGLVLAAAFTSLIAFRYGAPLLLVFLSIGLLAGEDGLGLQFDNAPVAYVVGSLALSIILFDSGFGTPLRSLRQTALPSVILSTLGVLLTAIILGVGAWFLLDLSWLEALLLGAIIGSTDAAAVFFLLRVGNLHLKDKVRATLEIESGSNDPIAIFLTLTLVAAVSAAEAVAPGQLAGEVAIGFIRQMGVGGVIGIAGGWLIVRLVQALDLERGLLPIFVLALSLLVFGIAGVAGGSGFLAVYLAGIVAGNRINAPSPIKRFQDGTTWLAQIIMFLMLGLFATPSQFPSLMLPAIGLALFLMFVARPLAVALCLAPFRFTRAETSFVSWVGLRGAVSILLALTPLIGGLENGPVMFDVIFIMVMTSLLIQGWTVRPLAKRLNLTVPPREGPIAKHEVDLPGAANHELLAYRVTEKSPVERGNAIPRWARPALVVRDRKSMAFQYAGKLRTGDLVYIFVPDTYHQLLDRLFASPAEVDSDDADFFGAFTIDPARPAADLEAAYSPGFTTGEQEMSIADLLMDRLGGRAEYADRVRFGLIELIVRETDNEGRPTLVGLSVEPNDPLVNIPVFLSPPEMAARLARFGKALRRGWHRIRTKDK